MSDIDDVLAYFDPGPRARECGDGERADTHDRARLELAQLRRAVEEMRDIKCESCGWAHGVPRGGSCKGCRYARAILAEIDGKDGERG